ncbi:hypothetical protein BG015_000199 [Linnemannia schmuckeri]|uniref:Uncharacterized protein n=1 Tax=Linnemannia schmuckeri TaxID=64567 RepID=A0A9P5RUU0_9FUNG|nr:hypothetical protein BG015_000199 [Linnemannia schmuckeri]
MYSAEEDQTTFDALDNVPTTIAPQQVYVVMSSPCSKDLPSNCVAVRALDAQAAEESGERILDKRATELEATSNDGKHKKHYHHHRHHHSKHHCRHHGKRHHGKHHHGKKYGHDHGHGYGYHGHHGGGNEHPYKDLCVAGGDFCGSKLYGRDFDAKTTTVALLSANTQLLSLLMPGSVMALLSLQALMTVRAPAVAKVPFAAPSFLLPVRLKKERDYARARYSHIKLKTKEQTCIL